MAGAGAAIQVMSVDDKNTAFVNTDTSVNNGAGSNFDNAFDSTPTRSSLTVSHVLTLQTGDYNTLIRRVALHNDTAANVTATSTTLVAGVDGLQLTKGSTFTLKLTFSITFASG